MPKIAIVKSIHPSAIDLLKKKSNFEFELIEDLSKENLMKKLPEFDALTLRTTKIDSDIINKCKKLKIISRHGVGYDNVDLNAAKKKKNTTGTTPYKKTYCQSNLVSLQKYMPPTQLLSHKPFSPST